MIYLISFGFKYGPPRANFLFDVTFLPNPARQPGRSLDHKLDGAMASEVQSNEHFGVFVMNAVELLCSVSATGLEIRAGFGCNGGAHRSRIVVQAVSRELKARGFATKIVHTDALS